MEGLVDGSVMDMEDMMDSTDLDGVEQSLADVTNVVADAIPLLVWLHLSHA